jgi:ribonuclease HI
VALKLDFQTTNNEAEYEAVIAGLSLAENLGQKTLKNSQAVVGHIQGGSEAKGEKNDKIPCHGFEFLGLLRTSGGHSDPKNQKQTS